VGQKILPLRASPPALSTGCLLPARIFAQLRRCLGRVLRL